MRAQPSQTQLCGVKKTFKYVALLQLWTNTQTSLLLQYSAFPAIAWQANPRLSCNSNEAAAATRECTKIGHKHAGMQQTLPA